MNRQKALRLAIRAMRQRIKALAFDANLYEKGIAEYPWAKSAHGEVGRLKEAIEVLEGLRSHGVER